MTETDPTGASPSDRDLHAAIMNLPCPRGIEEMEPQRRLDYKAGHRDARHAAAELAASCGRGCHCVTQCGDYYAHAAEQKAVEPFTFPEWPPLDTSQDWAMLDGAAAFQLIERHAEDWDDLHRKMETWRRLRSAELAKATGRAAA